VWRGRPRPRKPGARKNQPSVNENVKQASLLNRNLLPSQAFAGEGARATFKPKGKGQSDFSDWPLLMPATTYAPTHLARAVPSALRGLT